MLQIMRLITGIVAAALRCVRGQAGDPKSTIRQTNSCCPAPESACSCRPAKPFWPNPGDEVEAWSTHADAWFPAVVLEPEADHPWGPVVVRLKGNAPGAADRLRRDLVRPLRRLAAALRECGPDVDYDAYDRDNVRHMGECPGCRECADMRRYYIQCRKCGRTKHREMLNVGAGDRGYDAGADGLCWFCLPTWPYTRDHARLARERACASRV